MPALQEMPSDPGQLGCFGTGEGGFDQVHRGELAQRGDQQICEILRGSVGIQRCADPVRRPVQQFQTAL